jgi:hypothetical protein
VPPAPPWTGASPRRRCTSSVSSKYPSTARDWEARQLNDFHISPNRRARDTDYPINDAHSPIKIANFNGGGGTVLSDENNVYVRRPVYRFGFAAEELRTRFTKDWDIRNVRAMAAGLTPAMNDARMRFAFPSGISSIPLAFLLRPATDWPCDDVPIAATSVAVSLLGAA